MDTAQPLAAETDPNAALQAAADMFKAATTGQPVERPRDDGGRFTVEVSEPVENFDEAATGGTGEAEYDDDNAEPVAADETAQPMPPSWPEAEADQWNALPAETQSFLAAREAERERAVNAKFQESANARKAAEATAAEANANRQNYASALDTLMAAIQPVKPDPRAYGAGTGQYHREAFDLAVAEYEQQSAALAQLTEQRSAISQQEAAEAEATFMASKNAIEAEYAPKFIADVPELTDPVKAEPMLRALVDYAVAQGIPADVFAEANQSRITSPELHLLWKAQQFDKLRTAPAAAKPKPASPAARPGVSSPRSAQATAQRNKASDRLAREGSIEAGAAVFKHYM